MLNTTTNKLELSQRRRLESFGGEVTRLGVNFALCDAEGQVVLHFRSGNDSDDQQRLSQYCRFALAQDAERQAGGAANICRLGQEKRAWAVVLKANQNTDGFVAIIEMADSSHLEEDTKLEFYDTIFCQMLSLLSDNFQTVDKAKEQINSFSVELSEVYEELVLLHKLSSNMKVNEPDANYLQMACDSLTDIVLVEGIAILLKKSVEEEKKLVLVAGSGLIDIDERMGGLLYTRLAEELSRGKEALLDSRVDSDFKYDWPDNIKSVVAVPLCGKGKDSFDSSEKTSQNQSIIGLMVAINRINKPDFDSTDAKLFNSVANGCAVFVENSRLFGDLKELFIGSLKALTSSIDAKDEYTRGHSERVAFISKWIAERLDGENSMTDEEIHKVYLAGLLHDLGKLGINEMVLRKKGKLTDDEYAKIKKHPLIGAGILGGIKQMRDIVPGVLSHHERMDGRGYPFGLEGEKMPLIGKIISIADSFDAMTSRRTYRDAMNLEIALDQIRKGLGTQFDSEVGRVFLDSDTTEMWQIIQNGFKEKYHANDFLQYGAEAVGALII